MLSGAVLTASREERGDPVLPKHGFRLGLAFATVLVIASIPAFRPNAEATACWPDSCQSSPPDFCCDCSIEWDPDGERFCKECWDSAAPRYTECGDQPHMCPMTYDCVPT